MPHVELPSAEFKVVLLGDTNTGKTCLVLRFVDGSYKPASRSSTIGAFFLTKRLTVNNITCKILIWDTAGQEQFQKLTVTYYQNAAAAIVCYDVSDPNGLQRLRRNLRELETHQRDRPMVLVVAACKCDLAAVPRVEEEARALAASYGASYADTSARRDRGVRELFLHAAERVLERHEASVRGRARPLPVTVGGAAAASSRLSPTASSTTPSPSPQPHDATTTKARSTGYQSSPRSADGEGGDVDASSTHNNNKHHHHQHPSNGDHDSCTENESDEVVEEVQVVGHNNRESNSPGVTCEGSFLVCGVDDPGRTCVIL